MSSDSPHAHEAVFRFTSPHAKEIFCAVGPEHDDVGRSEITLEMDGPNAVVLTVHSDDLASLRAALNTWLRLISIAEEMQEIVQ